MSEIIDIKGNKAIIGHDDGKIITVPIASITFSDPKIGDDVRVYKSEQEIIVRRVNHQSTSQITEKSNKSKIVAGLLSIFLGWLGIGNFYLGKTGKGLTQLLITLFLFWLVIPLIVTFIWGLIEGIVILLSKPGSPEHKDGYGLELID
jgi:hypothetical protein